jgi:tetratricopeptide (TPR) repeat protein
MTDLAQALSSHRQGRLPEAMSVYEAILRADPGHSEASYYLALALSSQGDYEQALFVAKRGADQKPDPRALAQIGGLLLALSRPAEALGYLEQAVGLEPHRPEVLNNLGVTLRTLGKVDEALGYFAKALDLAPGYADARYNLAGLLTKCERYSEAIPQYEKLLALAGDSAPLLSALGQALWRGDRIGEAIVVFERAIANDPAFPDAYGHLGNIFIQLGRFEEAVNALQTAVRLAPHRGEFYRFLADVSSADAMAEYVAALRAIAGSEAGQSDDARIEVHFALGKIYADSGEPALAVEHLSKANALKRRFIAYDEPDTLDSLKRIAATFSATFIESRFGCSDPSQVPIFIFGMPRSGTTLIEQVLASHPAVYGAGELSILEEIATDVLAPHTSISPTAMREATCDELREIGRRYATALADLAPHRVRVTDKMPGNFRFAGLIRIVMPNARMIHAKRDAVETCFSCFSQYFAGDQPWAYDLRELGRYYRGYDALMDHWRSVLPPGAILDVHYEEMVGDFEAQARRILEYCGLDWDDACLHFDKTDRNVKTASASQVRRPIYRSSVHKSRKYAGLLQPLLSALGQSADVSSE